MRYLKLILLAVLITAATAAQAAAMAHAATARTGGRITLFTPLRAGVYSQALVTGAIGDVGRFVSIDRDGTHDANGDYAKIVLRQGSFEIDGRKLIHSLHPAASPNLASCSVILVGDAPLRVFDGTGAYAGIHGTLHARSAGGLVGRRHDGKCAQNGQPLGLLGLIQASGTVSY